MSSIEKQREIFESFMWSNTEKWLTNQQDNNAREDDMKTMEMTCRVPVLWCSFMQVMGK